MDKLRELLQGNKTYLLVAGAVIYEILGAVLAGKPIDLSMILTALMGATIRAGIKSDTAAVKHEVKAEVRDVKYDVHDVKEEVKKVNPAV